MTAKRGIADLKNHEIDNLLVHEPKPRNPRLAAAFKRIGLVEQTGRGVDRIFEGQLRYGRPAPDYARSDSSGVRVVLNGGEPSQAYHLLKKMSMDEELELHGSGRGAYYTRKRTDKRT